jgi:maltooligosyltrehalose trehalohydrolase
VRFRVWAPSRSQVQVVLDDRVALEGRYFLLEPDDRGYFSGTVASARAGSLYKFKLDDDDYLYPDPESRFQPEGPHGPSQVIDPGAFQWKDDDWNGIGPEGQIVYEMHIGTLTPEGTWEAARAELNRLASIGITVLEIMPIAEFGGRRGWGYDGVDLFAPTHLYGTPDQVRSFIDEAHRLGLGVILDVVYNHLGPDGNYVKSFAGEFFTDRYKNDWGESINFSSRGVRDFYLANATCWIAEFHFDGLRLDATQDIHDPSDEHILAEMTKQIRQIAGRRKVYIVAENEPQHSWMVHSPEAGGYGIDALWNDDFHHSSAVATLGRHEAYCGDYRGSPQEFVSSAKYGYLYQGQYYKWQKQRRGAPTFDLKPWNFVAYLQNHDQVANSARGERPNVLTHPALYRAMSALLMLGPATPMLFQGQEFGATTPFLFFCDHEGELRASVYSGRRKFLAQFPSLAQPEMQNEILDPGSIGAFETSKLDPAERINNVAACALYEDLIRLRREDAVLQRPGRVDGAVLSERALLLRYFDPESGDRLAVFNFGPDLHIVPASEPLLAPPRNQCWALQWSSENPRYGGAGTVPPTAEENWRIPAYSALWFTPQASPEESQGEDS